MYFGHPMSSISGETHANSDSSSGSEEETESTKSSGDEQASNQWKYYSKQTTFL